MVRIRNGEVARGPARARCRCARLTSGRRPGSRTGPDELSTERRNHLESLAKELGPWTQGPFLVGGDLIVGENGRDAQRWEELRNHLPDTLGGKRVLVLGSDAGYDAFMFHLAGRRVRLGLRAVGRPSASRVPGVGLQDGHRTSDASVGRTSRQRSTAYST